MSARSPGFTGVKDLPEEEALSLPPTCYSPAGANGEFRGGMEVTPVPVHLRVPRRGFQDKEPRRRTLRS